PLGTQTARPTPAPAPVPPWRPRHDRAVVVAHEDGEPAPVVDAGGGRIELIEPLIEERDVLGSRLVLDLQIVVGHARRRRVATPRAPRRPPALAPGSSPPPAPRA